MQCPNDLEPRITELVNDHAARGITLQPFVAAIGPNIDSQTDFYVVFNHIRWHFTCLLEALDICFKTYQVLDLGFQLPCKHLWQWLEFDIYGLPKSEGFVPKVLEFISVLESKGPVVVAEDIDESMISDQSENEVDS